jgi:hypothetical protein
MPDEFEPSHEPTASDIGSERPPQSERDRPDPASRFEAETAKSPRQQRQEDFLAAYANCDNITRAAEMAGIDRTTHHVWLREDPSYANRFERAQDEAADRLEFEAVRRVLEGDEVPVFYRGKQVGVRKEYSDKLLMFLLKTARPEKFGDAADLPAGPGKVPVKVVRYRSDEPATPSPAEVELDQGTRRRQNAFLAAYAKSGVIAHAARAAQIDRSTHYLWFKQDPTYPNRFAAAKAEASDRLELEAQKRAREGVAVPVFYQGQQVGVKKGKSVALLIFLLKGARREQARRALDIGHHDDAGPTIVCYPEPIDSIDEWSLRYPRLPSPSEPSR